MSRCCLGAALSWLHDGLLQGMVVPHWPFVSPWTVTLVICGLGRLRAHLLGLCCTNTLPSNLSTTTQGDIVKVRGDSSELCTLFIGSVWNSKTALARGPWTVLGYVGKRGWRVEGYWCLWKWVQWSPSIGGCLIASNERDVQGFFRLYQLLARSLPRRRSRRACVRAYVHFVCGDHHWSSFWFSNKQHYLFMCVCVYVYVCMFADMYICMYMHVCMYMYMYAFIHMCMCICMHICV